MPTESDKSTAGIGDGGEAPRLNIRRARLDRDGLYLFGRRRHSQKLTLTSPEIAALGRGRIIAVDIGGEHLLYVSQAVLIGDTRRQTLTSQNLGAWIIRTTSGAEIRLIINRTSMSLIRHGAPSGTPHPFSDRPHVVLGFATLRIGQVGHFAIEGWGGSYRTSAIIEISPDK